MCDPRGMEIVERPGGNSRPIMDFHELTQIVLQLSLCRSGISSILLTRRSPLALNARIEVMMNGMLWITNGQAKQVSDRMLRG